MCDVIHFPDGTDGWCARDLREHGYEVLGADMEGGDDRSCFCITDAAAILNRAGAKFTYSTEFGGEYFVLCDRIATAIKLERFA